METFDFEASVERRDAIGGTAKSAVLKQLENLKSILS